MGGKLILHATGAETEFQLGDTETTLGRGLKNVIALDDAKVSRRHALIRPDPDGGFLLLDLGSANGTFVNDRRIVTATRLQTGDVVRVGSTPLLFFEEAPASPVVELDRGKRTTVAAGADEAVLVGTSPAMTELFRMIEKAAVVTVPVLIEGESGTGKDLVASAVRQASDRAAATHVAVNCAAFTENLLESQLFGHCRGAFAGAISDHPGLFETADGGTVFLDEIGAIPLAMQPKLLRVLQEKEVTRLGETTPRKVDVRLITATNGRLLAAVERGSFRADLYYRLSAFPIQVPPLRERRADVPLLAQRFLAAAARSQHKRVRHIEEAALEALGGYDWPGNVRELENEIHRAVSLAAADGTIKLEHLSTKIIEKQSHVDKALTPSDAFDDVSRTPTVRPAATAVALLRNEGDYWTLVHADSQSRLRDSRGLRYLARLLQHPGQEFHVLDLVQGGVLGAGSRGSETAMPPSDGRHPTPDTKHPILDATARSAYRRRVHELREELDEAERFNDVGRCERLRGEIEAITEQLAAAVGLGGRDRTIASSGERARSTVTQRLRDAIDKISRQNAILGEHLDRCIRTGTFCMYAPDALAALEWSVQL